LEGLVIKGRPVKEILMDIECPVSSPAELRKKVKMKLEE